MKLLVRVVDALLGGLLIFNAVVVAHFLYEHDAPPWMYLMLGNTFLLGWYAYQQWDELRQRRVRRKLLAHLQQHGSFQLEIPLDDENENGPRLRYRSNAHIDFHPDREAVRNPDASAARCSGSDRSPSNRDASSGTDEG